MSDTIDELMNLINGKKIILFGSTTSARDILETVFRKIGIKAQYICDLKDEGDYAFENQYQEICVKNADVLKKENPKDIFVLITTLFDDEAADYLKQLKIENYLSARSILNKTIDIEEYWSDRYKKGYGTGVQTTGFLLEKQVEYVNDVICKNNIESVFELGCGSGLILPLLKLKSYVGVDISMEAIRICKEKFKDDASKNFYTVIEYEPRVDFDLSLSLGNVIPSIPDDREYHKYMDSLFNASKGFVCIFSSDFEGEQYGHIRARNFSRYVEENLNEWQLIEVKETGYEYKVGDPLDAKFYIYKKTEYSI